jgi:TPR repeat protein
MQAAVDLRASNDTLIDSQVMRLEWMPKQLEVDALPSRRDGDVVKPAAVAALAATPAPPLDPEELATLVRRGQDFIKTGDLAAARLVLRRAVTADDAQAALALGTTFDPLVFGELGVLGFQPDLAQARTWYERAAQLGSHEAQRRLDRLGRLPP